MTVLLLLLNQLLMMVKETTPMTPLMTPVLMSIFMMMLTQTSPRQQHCSTGSSDEGDHSLATQSDTDCGELSYGDIQC